MPASASSGAALPGAGGALPSRRWRSLPAGILVALGLTVLAKEVGLEPETFTEADHGLAGTIASPTGYAVGDRPVPGPRRGCSREDVESGAPIWVLISVTTIPAAASTAVAAAYSDWLMFPRLARHTWA